MKTAVLLVLASVVACKREPEADKGSAKVVAAPTAADAASPAPRDAPAAAAPSRMPIAAAKLELVGNATIKALEVSDTGEVRVGDKVFGALSSDGRFTRDGKVLAELGEDGQLLVEGKPAEPPIRIDPEGDVFLDGELMLTIGDDGKINTVDKDGVISENVMALLEGPPQGRRAIAMLLVLIATTGKQSPPPPPTTRTP